ncbi:MAG: 30S ribosomal protein S12 methylthiotransferase RimO [Syntrophothermaceae bacterium]|jgi:ribosomal protein S12 methylthiotransferase
MNKKVGFISLGCPKNQVDTEVMLGLLKQNGYTVVNRAEEADIIVVNTCGFIEAAKQEAIDTILEMGQLKQSGSLQHLVAAGCLAQRYGQELLQEMPELDAVVGVADFMRIAEVLDHLDTEPGLCYISELPTEFREKGLRILTTPPGWAYLKIADGCDNRCRYCAIPGIRGRLRSRPLPELVAEAAWLAAQGVRELALVAQDTTVYGQDLYKRQILPELLHEVAQVEGIEWLRIMYAHPAHLTGETIEVMAREEKVLPYLDLPVQHAADGILEQMGRGYRGEEVLRLLERLRQTIPGLVLRSTLMVGFPGESEEDFGCLRDFVVTAQFDWLGVFTYCREEGTPAADWEETVSPEIKQRRRDELMRLQSDISLGLNQARQGLRTKVLVEAGQGKGYYRGRTYHQAPAVDGFTLLKSDRPLSPGQLIEARVTGAGVYDLLAEVE